MTLRTRPLGSTGLFLIGLGLAACHGDSNRDRVIDAPAAPGMLVNEAPATPSAQPVVTPAPAPAPPATPPAAPPATPPATPPPVAEPKRASSITLALLPDTQYYSEGSPASFEAQTRWLATNAETIGKPFVMHLGDIIQSGTPDTEWSTASKAFGLLDAAKIDYSLAPGNHDLANTGNDDARTAANEKYLKYFPLARAQKVSTFKGRDPLGYSEYHIVERNGVKMLVMALDWRIGTATQTWAQGVLAANPTLPTILHMHEYASPNADGTAARSAYGTTVWNALVNNYKQVFLVVSGHYSGDGQIVQNDAAGKPVLQMVVDYQSDYAGGNGWMKFLELDFARNTIESLVFSPAIYDKFKTRGKDALSPYDTVQLSAARNKYTLAFDLRARFTDIGATLPAGFTEPQASLLDPVRKAIAEVPPPPSLADRPAPANADDYPKVSGTLAHWRFEQTSPGNIVLPTATVPDLSGNGNGLTREDTTASAPNTLQWSTAHHRLSASNGSSCFSSPFAQGGGYWRTAAGTALANEKFAKGYTIEAFVQLPSGYSHGFSGIVTRIDTGGDAGRTMGDLSEPAQLLGVSGSREAQFAVFPTNFDGIATAWSSPLPETQWVHLAATNDGHATKLFIDGYPAGRDPVYLDMTGLASGGKGFYVGTSHYGGTQSVFSGCIGEVRIVDHALLPGEFLLQRKPR